MVVYTLQTKVGAVSVKDNGRVWSAYCLKKECFDELKKIGILQYWLFHWATEKRESGQQGTVENAGVENAGVSDSSKWY